MATRTAPNPDIATPNVNVSTLHLVDASGDLYTDALTTTTPIIGSDLEAWADAYQLATQTSIYGISQYSFWEGDLDPDNADILQRNSGTQGINLAFRNPAVVKGTTPRVYAPQPSTMQGNQDIPLLGGTPLDAVVVAYLAMLSGYTLNALQYTTHKTRVGNPKVRA